MLNFLYEWRLRYLHNRAERSYWLYEELPTVVSALFWHMAEYRFLRAKGMEYAYAIDEQGRRVSVDHPTLYLEVAKFWRAVRLGDVKEFDFNDSHTTPRIGDEKTHDASPSVH